MNGIPRSLGILACVAALAVGMAGCQSTPKPGKGPARFVVSEAWAEPGTLVIFMPREVAKLKRAKGDKYYLKWSQGVLDYVDESVVVNKVESEGRKLTGKVKISSKTIPSSDYSLLVVGPGGRGVHIGEPLFSADDYTKVDGYLVGGLTPAELPKGSEALNIVSEAQEALETLEAPLEEPKKK